MIPNEPVIYHNIITEEERLQLRNYALDLLERGMLRVNTATKGNFRKFTNFYEVEYLTPLHQQIYHRIVKLLELKDPKIDPFLGLIISVISPGGYIHNHRDSYSEIPDLKTLSDKRNVRFNVMIDRGNDVSYDPHISDVAYKVNKCDAWCFGASVYYHHTPVIKGPENRIVYQFGFMLDAI